MRLVYKFRYPKKNETTKQLDILARISKNLYNEANYIIRQEFFNNGHWVRYYELNAQLKDSENYKFLLAQTSQQTLRILDKNWASYYKVVKGWKKNPSEYHKKPGIPRYKPKDSRFLIILTNQNSEIKKGKIIFSMSKTFKKEHPDFKEPIEISIPLPPGKHFSKYQQVRILPRKRYYEIEIVYEESIIRNPDLDKNLYLTMDLGVGNLVTGAENRNKRPIIVSGKPLKFINQFFNKRSARLLSIANKQGKKRTDKLEQITDKRNRFVNDYLHKTARFYIKYCLDNKIGNICIGKLKGIKDGVQLGRRNNQTFVNIPLAKLKYMIKYKAKLVGIKLYEVNEEYTSKCSSLDLEPVEKHEKYIGRRIKRGLFRGSNYLLNADVNGALNILRKVIGDDFIRNLLDRGCWFQPIRIRDMCQTSYEHFCLV